jgi:hypothetical protein
VYNRTPAVIGFLQMIEQFKRIPVKKPNQFRYILIAVMIFSFAAVILRYMTGSSCLTGSCGIGAGSNHGVEIPAGPQTFNQNTRRAEYPDVVVYYFHGTSRDKTCRDMECDTAMTLSMLFSDMLTAGRIDWRVVNIDLPQNAHFAGDFGIDAAAVVAARFEGRRLIEFKRLDMVRDCLGDIEALKAYFSREVGPYLNHD